jgi:hypothetical protein
MLGLSAVIRSKPALASKTSIRKMWGKISAQRTLRSDRRTPNAILARRYCHTLAEASGLRHEVDAVAVQQRADRAVEAGDGIVVVDQSLQLAQFRRRQELFAA